jgi:hypothetical protein
VDLAQSWYRQTARAAGASLIAPLAILLAAAVVAVGGGGLGGISSLTQIASGPDAPPESSPPSDLADASVIAAEQTTEGGRALAARTSEPETLSESTPAAPGTGTVPTVPPTGGPGDGIGTGIGGSEVSPPSQTTPSAPPPGPIGDLAGNVGGLGESLPPPLQPITNSLLELLLAPVAPGDAP